MTAIKAEVVRVLGACNAELKEGDTFLLRGTQIIPQGGAKSCQVVFASLVMNAGRLRLQEPVCVACTDPGTGEGGNVTIELSTVKRR